MKKSYRILDGYVWIMGVVLVAIIVISALCGCGAKKVVTEQVYVHDTLVVSHTDTFQVETWRYKRDTIRVETEKIVTLLQPDKALPAETIRVETNNWHFEREVVKDSTSKFVTKIDSVLKVLDQMHQKKELKKSQPFDWKGMILFLVVVGGLCVWLLVTKKQEK